ncbi:MAG: hypothetical protein AAB152_14640 [Candidatus Coatesbacteria bacterium]
MKPATGPIVSNASPLILLSGIGRFGLPESLFGSVLIAEEVRTEVAIRGAGRPGAIEVATSAFIRIGIIPEPTTVQRLSKSCGIGAGEAATLALAQAVQASMAIIDDRRGRAAAAALGIPVAGTVAVLELAHERGFLPDLRETYLRIRSSTGWIAADLLNASLERFRLPRIQ